MDSPQQHNTRNAMMDLALAAAEGFRSLSIAAQGHNDVVGGAPCWYCSSTVPVFNGAAIFDDRLLNPDTLQGIGEYFTTKGRPYSLLTMDALLPHARDTLHDLGYYEYDRMPAMWLDGLPQVRPGNRGNSDLWISRVGTLRDLATFRTLLSTVFYIGRDEIELVMGEGALDVPKVRHYLGWLGNEPVGTLTIVMSGPVPGIWNVGTLPQYRQRGVGTGMMHSALLEAVTEGHPASMLLASKEGVPMYEHLGYRTLSTMRIFVKLRED